MQVQQTTPQHQTIAQMIKRNPRYFFRAAEVIAFCENPDNDRYDHVTLFDPETPVQQHPQGLFEISKVVFGVPSQGGVHSLWVANTPAHISISSKIRYLADQIGAGYMNFPFCHHATWRHVAPVTGSMSAVYCRKNQALELNVETLEIEIIHGMQGVFSSSGNLILHVFGDGRLFEYFITPDDVERKRVPKARKIEEGVNCALTIPGHCGFETLIGRDDGLYLGKRHLPDTKGQKIRYLSAASEIRRVFWRANNGETWGMQFHNGCVASDIVQVDGPRDAQLHFAGTTFARGDDGAKNQTLALYRIFKGSKKGQWVSQRTLVPLPRALTIDPQIALTL